MKVFFKVLKIQKSNTCSFKFSMNDLQVSHDNDTMPQIIFANASVTKMKLKKKSEFSRFFQNPDYPSEACDPVS